MEIALCQSPEVSLTVRAMARSSQSGSLTWRAVLCHDCAKDRPTSIHRLLSKHHHADKRRKDLHLICASCSDMPATEIVGCDSLDCPVLYSRVKAGWDCEDGQAAAKKADKLADEWTTSKERLDKPSLVW